MKGSFTMKTAAAFVCMFTLFMMVFTVPAMCFDINIDIAPSTLNLAYQGSVVTVHTDIAYSSVSGATVELDGIEISWWKSDNRGNFVAKFNSEEVIKLVKSYDLPATVTLKLSGESVDGTFSGTSTISVIEVTGNK
jgi:hypothetical protein